MTAYVAVLAALVAGASMGPAALAVAAVGLFALIVGGPWGAILAGIGAASLALFGWVGPGVAAHPLLAPGLAVSALAAGLRALA